MNRRQFTHHMARYATTLPLMGLPLRPTTTHRMRKPTRLRPGDTVGLIAPGSPIRPEKMEKALANMEVLGLKVKYNPISAAKHGHLAGTDAERLADLHELFADPQVKAIWCIRGGYGCTRLLPHIDYKLIRQSGKFIIGYSDITALLQTFHKKIGLPCFHGPVASSTFTPYTTRQVKAMLMKPSPGWVIDPSELDYETESIRPGTATGCLVGGNLSLLAAMVGTPWEARFKNNIVFIEDIGEKPYRIDRMLTQLRQSSDLGKAAAIVLGVFVDCEAREKDNSLTLLETLKDRIYDLGIPTYYGFPTGHIDDQCTLPIGAKAEFDASTGKLRLVDATVS